MADDGSGTSWDPIKVEGEAPADGRAPKCRRRAPTPPSDAPALALVEAAGTERRRAGTRRVRSAPRDRPHALHKRARRHRLARLAAHRPHEHRCASTPPTPARLGVESGDEVKVTSARGSQTVAVEPDPGVPAGVVPPRLHRRRRRARAAHRRDRARHRSARGEPAVTHLLAVDPLFDAGMSWSVFVVVLIKVVGRVRDPARRGDALHLGDAQGHRRHAEPHRPQPRRPVRRAADARRRHQALLQGAVDPRLGRPAGVPARAVPVDPARVPAVLHRADRRHRSRSSGTRPTCRSPTSRSARCSSSRCRASACTA